MAKSENRKSRRAAPFVVALIAAGGALASSYLSYVHVQGRIGESVGGALCNVDSFLNCDGAAQSSFATILGVPIALLGLAFYVAILAVTVLGLSPKEQQVRAPYSAPAIAVTLFGLSLIYSMFLLGVSLGVLRSLCPFCAVLYVLNLGGLIAAWFWYGEKPYRAALEQMRSLGGVLRERAPLVFGVVFFATLLAGISVSNLSVDKGRAVQVEVQERRAASGALDESLYRAGHAPGVGPVDAPILIVEFSNFPCPHCGRLALILKQLREDFPDQVRVEYRHLPFAQQEHGHLAARAGVCAQEQGKFWPLHDAMFAGAPALSRADILGYAGAAGLDTGALDACIDSDLARRVVETDVAAGRQLGIQGTPTFFLNGERIEGALPYPELARRVSEYLR